MEFEYECDSRMNKPWSWVLKNKGVVIAQSAMRYATKHAAMKCTRQIAEESWVAFFKAASK